MFTYEATLKRIIFTLAILCVTTVQLFSQVPEIEWQKCLGGINEEKADCIQQTFDGGYIFAGYASYDGGDVNGTIGGGDCWIVKLNSIGSIQWQKCLGGTGVEADYGIAIQQTRDTGYIIATQTLSNDSNVTGNHGSYDCWVVKLDNAGNIQWQKCLGGTSGDMAYSIQQTSDNGYVMAGETSSNDDDVNGNHGGIDYWVVKLDSSGNLQWQKCLGGSGTDEGYSIQQLADGGYIVAGLTGSDDGDVSGLHGSFDYWVIKLNSVGNIQWQKCLGGSDGDIAKFVSQTNDGGCIVSGFTLSNDGDVTGYHDGSTGDYWIVKLDSSGNLQWQKCLGGSSEEEALDVKQSFDSGYMAIGYARSNDGDVTGSNGAYDVWVTKLNASGELQWQKCLGGSNIDFGLSIIQTKDSSYVCAGFTGSTDGDVNGNNGNLDAWVVKLSIPNEINDTDIIKNLIEIYPNPFSSSTIIALSLNDNSFTSIGVFDVTGKKLLTILNESLEVGKNYIYMNSVQLAAGIYFVRISLNSETVTKKVVVE